MRPSLLFQLANEPWFIAETIHSELLTDAVHASAFAPTSSDAGAVDTVTRTMALAFPQRPAATMEKDTGIAHVHIFGPLARNLPPLERAMGKTDFAQIHEDFAAAKAAGARGILLHIDSPGGTVNGTPEAADLVAASEIPVVVHARRAASAAYYIAAGAKAIVASPSAEVGSVGVMMPRVNLTGVMEKLGIKAETITNTAGDLKGISPTGELTPVQRAHLQETADGMFAAFRDHILNHRQVPATAMRGQTFSGFGAMSANLADAIGDPSQARAILLQTLSAGSKHAA